MNDLELTPLVATPLSDKTNVSRTDSEILEEHSKTSWPPEYLFEQELAVEFNRHHELYLDGEFWDITDRSDFDAFCRMMRSLKVERVKLEEKYLPDRVRVEESEEQEEQRYRRVYQEMCEENRMGFSFRRLFLGCFGMGGGQEN